MNHTMRLMLLAFIQISILLRIIIISHGIKTIFKISSRTRMPSMNNLTKAGTVITMHLGKKATTAAQPASLWTRSAENLGKAASFTSKSKTVVCTRGSMYWKILPYQTTLESMANNKAPLHNQEVLPIIKPSFQLFNQSTKRTHGPPSFPSPKTWPTSKNILKQLQAARTLQVITTITRNKRSVTLISKLGSKAKST